MKKSELYLSSLPLILFLALILMLCMHFRISTDDYYYLSEIEQKGVLNIISYSYFKWSGRFAGCTVMNSLFSLLHAYPHSFSLIPLSTFILLIIGVYLLISRLGEIYSFPMSVFEKSVLCLSFTALLFFMSFDIGETWFWCSSTGCYAFNILAFIWGLFFILHPRNTFFIFSGILVCFVFIGGSAEVYAFFFLLFLSIFIFHRYKNTVGKFSDSLNHKKLLVGFAALMVSFIILLIAPGNYLRDQLLPPHRFFFSFFIAGKSLIKFFVFYIPSHLPYLLAFSLPFFFAGRAFKYASDKKYEMRFSFFLKRSSLFFASFLVLFSYVTAYLMSETGPARLWFLVTFLFSVYCCMLFFYAGYSFILSEKASRITRSGGTFLATIILCYCLIHQFKLVSRYSTSFDEREKRLTDFNLRVKTDTVLAIPPLPPSGMLYPADITADASHYKNQHLRQGYKLQFQVIEN